MNYSDGFYKLDTDGSLRYAKNASYSSTINIFREEKDNYEYPIDGWYWFDTLEDAVLFFNLNIEDYTEQESEFQAPIFTPAPVPTVSVSAYQAKIALESAGLYTTVETFVRESNDNTLVIAWDNATVFERNSPFITSVGSELELTEEQIDTLFVEAAKVV